VLDDVVVVIKMDNPSVLRKSSTSSDNGDSRVFTGRESQAHARLEFHRPQRDSGLSATELERRRVLDELMVTCVTDLSVP